MRISAFSLLAALAVALGLGSSPVALFAQEFIQEAPEPQEAIGMQVASLRSQDVDPLQGRIAELERTVAELKNQQSTSIGGDSCCNPGHVGFDFYNCGYRCGGWTAGAEAVFLKPFATNGDLPGATITFAGLNQFSISDPFNYEATPRLWFGYVSDSGLGVRTRYWQFDQTARETFAIGPDVVTSRMEFRTLDLEVTQQVMFRKWKMLAFGGLRYAETNMDENFDFNGGGTNFSYTATSGFDGVGLTGGLDFLRQLGSSQYWSWFCNLRGSMLYGNRSYNYDFAVNTDIHVRNENDTIGILEIALGPQYARTLDCGATAFLRGGLEGQLWLNSGTAFSIPTDTALGDVGFAGFSIGAGIMR